jgi:hypothetical protein
VELRPFPPEVLAELATAECMNLRAFRDESPGNEECALNMPTGGNAEEDDAGHFLGQKFFGDVRQGGKFAPAEQAVAVFGN